MLPSFAVRWRRYRCRADGTDEWLWAVQLEPESAPMEGFRVSVSGLRQWAAGGWGPVTVS